MKTITLIALVAAVLIQQSRICALQADHAAGGDRLTTRLGPTHSAAEDSPEAAHTTRQRRSLQDPLAQARKEHQSTASSSAAVVWDPLAQARKEHLEGLEKQLAEISAPLVEDMASTMFHADIKEGQSLVTGGYHLTSAPTVTVIPGQNFSIEILSDNRKFYTLAGTAELSPSGSGVVLKARIQQKVLPEGP